MNKTKPRGKGSAQRVTVKLMNQEFRDALEDRGSIREVLIESFGSEPLARMCMTYLATSARYQARSHRVVGRFYFVLGAVVAFGVAALVRLFVW